MQPLSQIPNATRKEIMKHLKKNERVIISYELSNGKTIKEIATILNKSISTISWEIKRNKKLVVNNKVINIKNNTNYEMLENNVCSLLKKTPYVCNACPRYLRNTCSYHYIIYDEAISQSNYEYRIKKSKNSSTK